MIKTSSAKAVVTTLPPNFLAGCFGPCVRNLQTDSTEKQATNSIDSVFLNRSIITYDVYHGTQVEYHLSNGRSFLWSPGNSQTVLTNWKVGRSAVNRQEICYLYPSNSNNPTLGLKGVNRECEPVWAYRSDLKQVVKGDPYNLGTTRISCRLEQGQFTAEELFEKSGKSSVSLINVYPE